MKKYTFYTWMTMLFILPLWVGCSNEADESNDNIPVLGYTGQPIPIQISVSNSGGGTTRAIEPRMVFSQPLDKNKDTGYDIVTTITPVSTLRTRANSPLANVHYRLLAYTGEISKANFAGQGEYKTDETGKGSVVGEQLLLPEGHYTFVCYSYGKNEEIPLFDGTSTLLTVTQGDEFMSCIQTNIEVKEGPEGEFVLNNLYVRQCARVVIEVSATGFADNAIAACAATLNNLNDNSVTWDFSTSSALPITGTSGSANFTWDTLNDETVTSAEQIVLPTNNRSLSITLTSLTIGTENFDNTVMDYSNVQLNPAGNYKITVSLERNYIPVGGYKWAKGNLYKDGVEYYFEATQEGFHEGLTGGTYFDWNSLEAGIGTQNKQDYDYAKDPCSKVAPAGTWKTPSKEEFIGLITNTNATWDNTAKGIWFGTEPYRVFLPAIGVRSPDSPPLVINTGEFAYYSSKDGSQFPYYYNACLNIDKSFGAIVVDEMDRTLGMPIRCVKK